MVKKTEPEAGKNYAEVRGACSQQKRRGACWPALGKVGVKNRVKSVLNYKKPVFWIVAVTVVVGIAVAVCFLTNPVSKSKEPEQNADSLAIIGGADGSTAIVVGNSNEEEGRFIDVEGNVLKVAGDSYGTYEEGLYVFIWQLAANSYYYCVKEKTEQGYTFGELWSMKSIGLEGARLVVKDSGYSKEAVTIVPFSMPYSSYLNEEAAEDPKEYQEKLEALFWGE